MQQSYAIKNGQDQREAQAETVKDVTGSKWSVIYFSQAAFFFFSINFYKWDFCIYKMIHICIFLVLIIELKKIMIIENSAKL